MQANATSRLHPISGALPAAGKEYTYHPILE